MKTVLVTGGAGFIGSCYVLSRRTAGERVVKKANKNNYG